MPSNRLTRQGPRPKSNRPVSCSFCQSRKLRCSREVPCSNCSSRGIPCEIPTAQRPDVERQDSISDRSEPTITNTELLERLQRLETLLANRDAPCRSPATSTGLTRDETIGDGPDVPHLETPARVQLLANEAVRIEQECRSSSFLVSLAWLSGLFMRQPLNNCRVQL